MREKPCPAHVDPEKWEYYNQVVDEAIRQMHRYLENPTEDAADLVRAWLSDVRAIQDHYEQQAWGPVRLIQSTEVLLIEYALSGLDHGVGHFRPLSITRQRHLLAYH